MEKDIYYILFEDPTTKAALKSNALGLVDEWYCRKMLDISNQMDPSPEATTMMTMVKKIHFSYQARNGNYLVINNLENFGFMLDYYFGDSNGPNELKNFGKWHNTNKKYTVLYKETPFLYPTEQGISKLDWTKITEQFIEYQTFTGLGTPALTNEVVQIATGFKEMSEAKKIFCAETEATKETIDTTNTDFPTGVTMIYNKVQQLQRLWKLLNLVKKINGNQHDLSQLIAMGIHTLGCVSAINSTTTPATVPNFPTS